MGNCYEYFNCDSFDCSKRNNDKHCWELECDFQHTHSPAVTFLREEIENKNEACKLCFYYKEQTEVQNTFSLSIRTSNK